MSREILELLNTSTAKEQSIVEKFRSRGRAQVQEFCDHGTKEECTRSGFTPQPCTKLHFRSVLLPHTTIFYPLFLPNFNLVSSLQLSNGLGR
jgi:mRNA (2'-O-methyladenosine-N6-)-methyltransferase